MLTRAPVTAPWIFFVLGLLFSAIVWYVLTTTHNQTVKPVLDSRINAYTELLDARIDAISGSLTRVSERWTVMDGTTTELWRTDARGLLRDLPILADLEWVDANHTVQWHTSRTVEDWTASDEHRLKPAHRERLAVARQLEHEIATVIARDERGTRLDIFVPIQNAGQIQGFVRGSIDLERLLTNTYAELGLVSHLRIAQGDTELFHTGDAPVETERHLVATSQMVGPDFKLHAELLPTQALFAQHQSWHPTAVAIFAVVATGLLTLLMRQYGNLMTTQESLIRSAADLGEARAQSGSRQAHLDSVYNVVPVGVAMLDRNLRFTFANERMSRMMGKPVREHIGQTPQDIEPIIGARLEPFMQYALNSGQVLENVEVSEPAPKKGESARNWLCSFHPAHDQGGTLIGIAAAILDITSLKEAEQENVDLSKKLFLTQKTEALGRLTGGVAHDFNNMLGVILGSLEFVKEKIAGDRDLTQLVQRIEQAAEHSAELIRQLLAFARQQPLVPKDVNVRDSVESLLPLVQRTIGEDIEIHFVAEPDLWIARVDDSQLGSAILNLVINARDAMPEGGKITIELANAMLDENYTFGEVEVVPGDYVMISISDTGTGMSAETTARAFEPFFTTKESGKGSGLGLSMVFGFVKQSQGHLKIYSELGVGTAVKLYLPRAANAQSGTMRGAAEKVLLGNEKILVVEDDAMMRDIAVRQLKSLGYTVVSAAGGSEALVLLDKNPDIAMLLTDVVMPGGMNGPELAKVALERRPDLKVMFVSGYTDNALIDRGWLSDGVQLLQKPYRRTDLASKVRATLLA